MYISIGKNLKFESTNDTKVSKLVRDYSEIHNMIETKYPDTTQEISLKDFLEVLLENFVISWSHIPEGATFVWRSNGVVLPNPYTAKNGENINYVLTYSDGSKCLGSFTVSRDFDLDLRTLEPNKFIVSVTADKTLSKVRVYHNYVDSSSPYIELPLLPNNIYDIECDKNETIRVTVQANGWSEVAQTPDFDNNRAHIYSNITQNISETYSFPYESYISISVGLIDENGHGVVLDDSYLQYITWSPSDSTKWRYEHIANEERYNAWKDKSVVANYTINVPNYAPITGTFDSQQSVRPTSKLQIKTLIPMVTYTVVPLVDNPQDATVTFAVSGYTGEGNRISVPKGTTVAWVIDCPGYISKAGSAYVDRSFTEYVQMDTDDIHEINITDYEYSNIDYHLELNKYIGSSGNVIIPNI